MGGVQNNANIPNTLLQIKEKLHRKIKPSLN